MFLYWSRFLNLLLVAGLLATAMLSHHDRAQAETGPDAGGSHSLASDNRMFIPPLTAVSLEPPRENDIVTSDDEPVARAANRSIFLPLVTANHRPPVQGLITPQHGGVISTGAGGVTVALPPGAVARATQLTIAEGAQAAPPDVADFGLGVEITAQDDRGQPVTTLLKPATLTFAYNPARLIASRPSALAVFAQGSNGRWEELPSTLDDTARTVRAQTNHFSGFGLYSRPWETPNNSFPDHLAVDGAGNIYFIINWPNSGSGTLWRYRPGRELEPYDYEWLRNGAQEYFQLYQLGVSEGQGYRGSSLAVDPDTGVIFVRRHDSLFRIEADGKGDGRATWRRLYPSAGDTTNAVKGMAYSVQDRTVWVWVGNELRQLNAQNGQVQQRLALPFDIKHFVFDSRGRLFVTVPPNSRGIVDGHDLSRHTFPTLFAWTPATQSWRMVADGVVGNHAYQHLAADSHGQVFLLSRDDTYVGTVLVFGGETPGPLGVLPTHRQVSSIAIGAGQLVLGSNRMTSIPAGRSPGVDGILESVTATPLGSLSGAGNVVTLRGTIASVPALHAVHFGDQRLPLLKIEEKSLHFGPLDDEASPAPLTVRMGQGVRTLGQVQTIEPGNHKPFGLCTESAHQPLQVAVNEWVAWGGPGVGFITEVTSHQGLFASWLRHSSRFDLYDDPQERLSYRFTQPGDYTFTVKFGSATTQTLECKIRVSYAGAPMTSRQFRVDPAAGGVFYNNGARMEIPPGALPGSAPYTLTLRTAQAFPPAANGPQPVAAPYPKHTFDFAPEPPRLLGTLRLSIPYDPKRPGDLPMPTFFDDADDPDIPADYRMKSYLLLDHSVEVLPGYVTIPFEAGDYARPTSGASVEVQSDLSSWSGKIRSGLNDMGANLWYKAGMPNKKLESTHFTILYYHSGAVGEEHALAAHEGLSRARDHFRSQGYKVPSWVIVNLDFHLQHEGSVSGLGRLRHWNMSLGAWQDLDELRSAAAHEMFHLIQYENMSYDARARKSSWKWWMEGTAVWAETVLFPNPNHNSASHYVKQGADFVHRGMNNYGGLSDDQAYATVALITYLEQHRPGIVLEVLKKLGLLTGPQAALKSILHNPGAIFEGFAEAYFQQKEAPYSHWDISKATTTITFTTPVTNLLPVYSEPLSARGVHVVGGTGAGVPVSFAEADGSVIRVTTEHDAATFAWNPDGSAMPTIHERYPEDGRRVAPAPTFTAAKPLKVVYVNRADGKSVLPNIQLEVPTLMQVKPATIDRVVPVHSIQLEGDGFGKQDGKVLVGGVAYNPIAWSEKTIYFQLESHTLSPGTFSVSVQHAAGVISNAQTLTIR